jgi:hypothetical protein
MYLKTLTSLGNHIRKVRLDRGLLRKDVALALGVDLKTVAGWEMNRYQPHLARGFFFLGYTPAPYDREPTGIGSE